MADSERQRAAAARQVQHHFRLWVSPRQSFSFLSFCLFFVQNDMVPFVHFEVASWNMAAKEHFEIPSDGRIPDSLLSQVTNVVPVDYDVKT